MRLRFLPSLFLLRRALGELRGIRAGLERQNVLLARLADRFAPLPPVVNREQVQAETGVDFVDAIDQVLAQEYVARTEREMGYTPSDDQILTYLSDEKTHDLHQRLIERDAEMERVRRERAWET